MLTMFSNISDAQLARLVKDLERDKDIIISHKGDCVKADKIIEQSLSTLAADSVSPVVPICISKLWTVFPSLQACHS